MPESTRVLVFLLGESMLYLQFQDLKEISEFSKLSGIPEAELSAKYKAAEQDGKICVFEFEDTSQNRQLINGWRNRMFRQNL